MPVLVQSSSSPSPWPCPNPKPASSSSAPSPPPPHLCSLLPLQTPHHASLLLRSPAPLLPQSRHLHPHSFPDHYPFPDLSPDAISSPPSHPDFYAPSPDLFDPVSLLVYQHALPRPSRNMQFCRFLLFCRAWLNSAVGNKAPYCLVSKNFTKVVLPSRRSDRFRPSMSPVSRFRHRLALAAAEISACFHRMGHRYGSSLLFLLVLGYWIQGFRCFPWLAVSYHLKDGLHVDPATLQFLQSTVNLPMVAKPVYGIVSDAVYIRGARRMPYLLIAGNRPIFFGYIWVKRFANWSVIGVFVTSGVLQVCSWCIITVFSGVRSSLGSMIGVLVVGNVGAAIAEVVNDALVAESVRKERGRSKGELQSFVWLALALGGALGNLSGGLALSRLNATSMFGIFTTLAAAQLATCVLVKEKSFTFKVSKQKSFKSKENLLGLNASMEKSFKASTAMETVGNLKNKAGRSRRATQMLRNLKQQAQKLVEVVGKPEILRLLTWFAASYAVIPAMGGSLFYYQTQFLKINPTFLGLAKVIGQLGLLTGSLLFNRFLKKSSPRKILATTQILLSLCMLSDLLLVSRWSIRAGIPDHIFVLGTSAFVEAIAQFKVLPFMVLLTQLCPAGSEGSLLSFFMSCHCLASILSGYMGIALASFLHLSADSFSGLPLGILIQSSAALLPLLWISNIPCTSNEARFARVKASA